jgi:hypothetical protein
MRTINIRTCLFCAASLQLAITSAAFAESRISFLAAGEAYDGAPAFEVRMGDAVIGRGELAKSIDTVHEGRLFFSPSPEQYIERIEFSVDDKAFRPDAPVSVILVNDKFSQEGWGRDRNLFIRSVTVNGATVGAAGLRLTDGVKVQNVNRPACCPSITRTTGPLPRRPQAAGRRQPVPAAADSPSPPPPLLRRAAPGAETRRRFRRMEIHDAHEARTLTHRRDPVRQAGDDDCHGARDGASRHGTARHGAGCRRRRLSRLASVRATGGGGARGRLPRQFRHRPRRQCRAS